MATQVREGHFQACKLLTLVAEMVSWYQILDWRSPEHRSLFYSWVPDRASFPRSPPKCANLALSPVLLSAKVEVKMSGFPERQAPHAQFSCHPQQPVPFIIG